MTVVAEEAEVMESTVSQCTSGLEVCSTKLVNTPIGLGGRNVTVQIDELLFRHKPKYHPGRVPRGEQWVFGLVDTSSSPSLGYMELIPRRDAQTILPIIQAHTHPGTTIYSDQWQAYNTVEQLSTVSSHSTVNHSINFVDPTIGVESYWITVLYASLSVYKDYYFILCVAFFYIY